MFFVKQISETGEETLINLDSSELYGGWCPKCGKEYALSNDAIFALWERDELYDTDMYCQECSKCILKEREKNKIVKFPIKKA